MNLRRLLRHWFTDEAKVRRTFPAKALAAIERAIGESERSHSGQIRFVVEASLETGELLRDMTARERAVDVFSHLRVWDTEHNSGVLIYVLLADRDVEIVADRGIHRRCGPQTWERICKTMEEAFRTGRFEEGALAGIRAAGERIAEHFPAQVGATNELSDRPVLL